MTPAIKFLFSRLFPWPFIIVGALVSWFGVRSLLRAEDSVKWPTVQGVVQSSSMEYHSGGKGGGTYHAHVLYNYNLNGTAFSGDRIAYGDYGSSNPSHAQEIVNRYPAGAKVTVYYMRTNPEECLLEPGIKAQAWFLPGFGIVFLVAGVAMAVFLPKVFAKVYPANHQFDEPNKIQ
jgi:hypothetical protein